MLKVILNVLLFVYIGVHCRENHKPHKITPLPSMGNEVSEFENEKYCKDKFCENVPSYPKDTISKMLKDKELLKYLHKYTGVSYRSIPHHFKLYNDDISICSARRIKLSTRLSKNMLGDYFYVINQKEFSQQMIVEICNNEAPCEHVFLPFGYQSRCTQEYDYRSVYAIENSTGNILLERLWFPSHCACRLENVMMP